MTPTNDTETVAALAQLLRSQDEARTVQIEHIKRVIAIGRASNGGAFQVVAVQEPTAASERHANGSLAHSLAINNTRFGIDEQLASILHNTAKELGWLL